ncbi:hypothetical protein K1T71_000315 [Dendrolimus kikuchii]|uniref:Uncharacterized protein n=1 Tax=Dendrolimus kikuchii TaxID=765133 RepID=A0ACC1DKE9_9NEOP|nr:hypothetical protein K1T71_000315 [Dendrolimus kikuchii]
MVTRIDYKKKLGKVTYLVKDISTANIVKKHTNQLIKNSWFSNYRLLLSFYTPSKGCLEEIAMGDKTAECTCILMFLILCCIFGVETVYHDVTLQDSSGVVLLTLPPNTTADFVFETLRLAPLLHATYISELRQKQDLYLLQTILDMNNVSIAELFQNLSPAKSCAHLVEKCMWKNILYECEYLFKQVFSLLNLCCTFNYYAVDPTFYRETLSQQALRNGSPRHVASCGYQTALTVVINTNANDYYSASFASQGALVFVDNAYNIPDMDSPVRMINPSTEVMIALSPETTYATLGVRSFSPEKRQCYYEDEVRLGVLRQYSFHNCMAYRKVKTIERICECVPFFFPSIDERRHCNFKDLDCLQFILKPSPESKNHRISVEELDIQCLPDCEHYSYPLKVSLGNLAKNVHLNGRSFYNGHNLENRSLLNVFFNDLVSTRYRRDVYLNWQNVLASFGGLLSLMLGFTLIAGFDVVLFFITWIGYDSMKTHSDLNTICKPKK